MYLTDREYCYCFVKKRGPDTRLCRTAATLRKWHRSHMSEFRLQEAIANDVIFSLDVAQEERPLSDAERELHRLLKARLLGIAALDRIRWRQQSRLTGIKCGVANTRLFQLWANGRRQKNHIPVLKRPCGTKTSDHEEKAKLLLTHFKNIMRTPFSSSCQLNWNVINLPAKDLGHLESNFTMEELKEVVDNLHSEKAPGPDGFTGLFYKKCWGTVCEDLLMAINQLHSLKADLWNVLNSSNIALIPKKEGPFDALDF